MPVDLRKATIIFLIFLIQTLCGRTVWAIESHVKIWIEAEEADALFSPFQVEQNATASRQKFIVAPNGIGNSSFCNEFVRRDYIQRTSFNHYGGLASYAVPVQSPGEYVLWGRVSTLEDSDGSCYVQIDAGPIYVWDVKAGKSWHWDRVKNRGGDGPMVFDLAPGQHLLRIIHRGRGVLLDLLGFTQDKSVEMACIDPVHQPLDRCEIWIEAEDTATLIAPLQVKEMSTASKNRFVLVPMGAGQNNLCDEAMKNDFANFTQSEQPAGMAAYSVDIVEPGEYVLWGQVIAPSGRDDSFFVQMDDGPVYLWDVRQGLFWHWVAVNDRFGEQDPVVFTLTSGRHVIKIIHREDGTMLDRLLLVNDRMFIPNNWSISEPEIQTIY